MRLVDYAQNFENILEKLNKQWKLIKEMDQDDNPRGIRWQLHNETDFDPAYPWLKDFIKPFEHTKPEAPQEHPEILELLDI